MRLLTMVCKSSEGNRICLREELEEKRLQMLSFLWDELLQCRPFNRLKRLGRRTRECKVIEAISHCAPEMADKAMKYAIYSPIHECPAISSILESLSDLNALFQWIRDYQMDAELRDQLGIVQRTSVQRDKWSQTYLQKALLAEAGNCAGGDRFSSTVPSQVLLGTGKR